MSTSGMQAGHGALRVQGTVFCVLAVLGLAATPWLMTQNQQHLLIGVGMAIFFLGVPHGALDIVFARKLYHLHSAAGWLLFITAYLVLAVLVVLLWHLAPRLFLTAFLLISAFHFSGDPIIDLPAGARMLYGSAVIVLPTLLHPSAVMVLFTHLIGPDAAAETVFLLQSLAIPVLVGEILLIGIALHVDRHTGIEILCLVLLSIFATPLIAFMLFFCGMHGPRHFLRTALLAGMSPKTLLLRIAVVPMLACLVGGTISLVVLVDVPFEERLTRIVFVGLAALTVPHMVLVEWVRHHGWRFCSA